MLNGDVANNNFYISKYLKLSKVSNTLYISISFTLDVILSRSMCGVRELF